MFLSGYLALGALTLLCLQQFGDWERMLLATPTMKEFEDLLKALERTGLDRAWVEANAASILAVLTVLFWPPLAIALIMRSL